MNITPEQLFIINEIIDTFASLEMDGFSGCIEVRDATLKFDIPFVAKGKKILELLITFNADVQYSLSKWSHHSITFRKIKSLKQQEDKTHENKNSPKTQKMGVYENLRERSDSIF